MIMFLYETPSGQIYITRDSCESLRQNCKERKVQARVADKNLNWVSVETIVVELDRKNWR
jgi:hypothetical protein